MIPSKTQRRKANRSRSSRLRFETLETRQLLAANVQITEFMASNGTALTDGNGQTPDWIELHNSGDMPANLLGYSLTDKASDPTKFVLPTKTIGPGEYVVVFASGDNAPDAAGNIHANFKLSAGGEYVGLFDPDGVLLSEFGVGGVDYPPQVTNVSFGLDVSGGEYLPGSQRYFVRSSPGQINTPMSADLAPIVSSEKASVAATDGQRIIVTAEPVSFGSSILNVILRARVNYGSETTIAMLDNGVGDDLIASDGIYTAAIPASMFDAGDMVRWRITSLGSTGLTGKGPRFLDPLKSPEYFGTVVADSSINTPLPVIEWFTNNTSGAQGSGARGSVFYNGEFYDNVFIRRRGQSSNNSPKKNLKFDFNPGDRFLLTPDSQRVDEINLSNTYYDQADVRQTLSSETFQAIGQPSPLSFPIHTRRNGEFFSLAIYIEQVDDTFLERNGLDPNGALYKADGGSVGNNGFNEAFGLTGFLKRTRLDEGNEALAELAQAVDPTLPQATRAAYLYDNVDLFSVINYMAGIVLMHNADHLGKNHYVYQDTDGTGKWSFLPWDLDLTFGKNGANTPSTEVYDADVTNLSSNRYPNSHPFFGSSEYTRFANLDLYNRLIDAVLDTPELKEIFLRRLRSAMDIVLQAPGTAASELKLEARLAELLAAIEQDWNADDEKWIEAPQTNLGSGIDWGEDLPLATHFQRLIDRYLVPRRNHLYNTHSIDNVPVVFTLLETTAPFRYIVPTGEIPGWETASFDANAWTVGNQGIGYERGSGYQTIIQTDVESELFGNGRSAYTRTEFNIGSAADLADIANLTLNVRYDDGFIAYLNGVEVTRSSNAFGSGFSATSGNHEASSTESFILNQSAVDALVVGDNVLAIQVINQSPTSSDLLLEFSLDGASGVPGAAPLPPEEIAGIPSEQMGNPQINFDTADFDASPISGSQREEYLRLNNPNATAVDLSGWRLGGGVNLTFRPGTVIPAGGQLFAVADVAAFNARAIGPSGGQSLLTHGNYSGQLGFLGETVRLIAPDGEVVDSFAVPATVGNDLQSYLRVTEISYSPDTASGAEEFIELTNISTGGESVTLDLGDVRITDGPSAPFVFPESTTLAPGQRLLVVKDIVAFQAKYPSVAIAQIAGQFAGSLSGGGELIRIEDSGNNTIFAVNYSDSDPWPIAADGIGATLVLRDETNTDFERLGKHYAWRSSVLAGGTPGAAPLAPTGVVINEVLAHTDLPDSDSIELFNTSDQEIDISGWYLSDSGDELLKYQIPAETVLAAGGFIVFDEGDFNPTPGSPGPNDFALSSSAGDEIYLTRESAGAVTHFEAVAEFGATFNGQSLGRVPGDSGRLVPLSQPSLGTLNGAYQFSDIVISEVNYHPGNPSLAARAILPTIDDNDLEFIELHNPQTTSQSLDLWRLRGQSDFNFTAAHSLAGGETLLAVNFDPDVDTELRDAFRAHYEIDATVRLVGPLSDGLGNSDGVVKLQRPDESPAGQPTVTPNVLTDGLVYDDLSPWPTSADGGGDSLQRIHPSTLGFYVDSWQALPPTPGSIPSRPIVESVSINGGSVSRSLVTSLTVQFDREVDAPASAFVITNRETGTAVDDVQVSAEVVGGKTVATLTFLEDPLVTTRPNGSSLIDGTYELRIVATEIHSSGGGLRMGLDYEFGILASDNFFRLFGDSDGDRDVDGQDYGRFGLGFLRSESDPEYNAQLDHDGDGDIDGQDYGQFGLRFLTSLSH